MKYSNIEAEKIILGTIIMNNAYLSRVAEFLLPHHFCEPVNQKIFEQINITVNKTGIVANQITLKQFFENDPEIKEVGGLAYLSNLLSIATGVVDIRDYAREVLELWQKRGLEDMLRQSLIDLDKKDFTNVSASLENDILGLAFQEPAKKTQHISEIIDDIERDDALGISNKFTPTGFKNIDDMLNGGIHSKQLVIIGARPSVGKTTIAQNIIINASRTGKKCLFISLEVDKKNVYLKFLSNVAMIDGWKLQRHGYNFNQSEIQDLNNAKSEIRQMGIFVDDSSSLRVSQIGHRIKNQLQKQAVDLVIIDYIQIIKGDDIKNKNEAIIIKDNTTMLKGFAKQFDVGILALAQINRKAVEGANQEPTINDFKSSGGIEEDADVAVILHRDRSDDKKEGYFSANGKLIVAKNRFGRTGEVSINFDGNLSNFKELGEF